MKQGHEGMVPPAFPAGNICSPTALTSDLSFNPNINCCPIICLLQLLSKRNQNNTKCRRKAGGQSWPEMFSLPPLKFCRFLFKATLCRERENPKGPWEFEFLGLQFVVLLFPRICLSVKENHIFSFLPLRCSCCHLLAVTNGELLRKTDKWSFF